MGQTATLADQLVQVIEHYPGYGLDELVMLCPDYPWNQILLEVDRLSREDYLQFTGWRCILCGERIEPGAVTQVVGKELVTEKGSRGGH